MLQDQYKEGLERGVLDRFPITLRIYSKKIARNDLIQKIK